VLTGPQILAHYNAASSTVPGTYSTLVKSDGALLYLQNAQIPEPGTVSLLALGLFATLKRPSRRKV
jgi:PEP-CTERM motif